MTDSVEEWKPVVGYEKYEVSNLGAVRRKKSGRRLKAFVVTNGYHAVCLSEANISRTRNVHNIVCDAYLGVCPNGLERNHKDGDKANNRASNLEYVTHTQNMHHAAKLGLLPPPGKNHGRSKLALWQVQVVMCMKGKLSPAIIADMTGIKLPSVYHILGDKGWRHVPRP